MNDIVKKFLWDMRQHSGFQMFLRETGAIAPQMPKFKKGTSVEQFGAETLFASGKIDQHQRWIDLLTGGGSSEVEEKL